MGFFFSNTSISDRKRKINNTMLLGKVARYSGETSMILILKEGSANNTSSHIEKNPHTEKKLHQGWDFMYHKKSENSTDSKIKFFTDVQEAV